jgi:Transposase IS200 like
MAYVPTAMPRLPRSHLAGGCFQATARAVFGAALFEEDLDRLEFLQLLRSTAAVFDWRCHAHCLMGTHYHLLLETSQERLSTGMRRLNGDYARRFNKRHGRRGHLFDERFASHVIRDEGTSASRRPVRASEPCPGRSLQPDRRLAVVRSGRTRLASLRECRSPGCHRRDIALVAV